MVKISSYKKIISGVLLAAVMFVFSCMNMHLFTADNGYRFETAQFTALILLSAGTLLMYLLDFRGLPKWLYTAVCAVITAAVPFIIMQIAMFLSGDIEYSMSIYMVNLLLYTAPLLIMYTFTASFPVSATVAVILGLLFNMASYVLGNFRGTPFIPTDILAINTAANVASNYKFTFEWQPVSAILLAAFAIGAVWAFPLKIKFKKSRIFCRLAGAAAFIVLAVSFYAVDYMNVDIDVFDQTHATHTHGTAYNFFINARKMQIHKPGGYDESAVLADLDKLDENTDYKGKKPNIIVIMNESYSDLTVINDFDTNISYNKFFKSLDKNTIRGELLVSPFGGYTCNTEFEFLSGLSMGLLPSGVAPYLQYINKECPYFLPAYMNSLGYKTVALHPYYANGWNRETVYPLMGFDEFISIENMGDYQDENTFETVRSYYSDNTSYSAVIEQFERKGNKPLFMFNVTMQNHGGYTYSDSRLESVKITGMKGEYPNTENYLSLLKKSDDALEILIDYFKRCEEPTIVVFFGDHQPAIESEFYEELYDSPLEELSDEELLNRYKVPFFIWANYDIDSKTDVETSVNYLSGLVLDTAGLPRNKINLFLDDINSEIPRINASGHYDANGNWNDNDPDTSDTLRDYNYIEYFMMTHKPNDKDKP